MYVYMCVCVCNVYQIPFILFKRCVSFLLIFSINTNYSPIVLTDVFLYKEGALFGRTGIEIVSIHV